MSADLEKIAAHVPGVVYQYQQWPDGRSAFPYASRGLREIYGVDPEEVIEDATAVFEVLHPDDLADVAESIARSSETLEVWRARYRVCHPSGRTIWVEGEASPEVQPDGSVLWHGYIRDVTEQVLFEERQTGLVARYRTVVNASSDGFLTADDTGRITEVNDRICERLGYSREELLAMRVPDIHPGESGEQFETRLAALRSRGQLLFETDYRCKDGRLLPVEVSLCYASETPHDSFAFVRDIRARHIDRELAELRAELAERVFETDEERLLRVAVDTAERLTRSEVGFLHFVREGGQQIDLQTWSTATLNGRCGLTGSRTHYALSEAGTWADPIRLKQPIIHNDYPTLPDKRGYPQQHVAITRGLYVPVIRGDEVVAVLGVGNKASNYDQYDVSLVTQVAEITYDYVERNFAEQRVQRMAFNDMLTGLPNRRLLSDRLEQSIALARREDSLLAICYLDLDGFKPVNDRWGHEAGDRLLVEYTERLRAELRDADTLARIGGDEFVILMTQIEKLSSIERVLDRFLQVSAEPFLVDGKQVRLSASIGVTVFPNDDVDSDALIRHADHAMYTAKNNGKNTFAFYDIGESERAHQQRLRIVEFERALVENQLLLHLQPRIELRSGVVMGFEALVRWQHPQRGILYPDEFLDAIDGTPLQLELDRWVLSEATALHRRWRELGERMPISVNLCPYSLGREDFPTLLRDVLGDPDEDVAPYFELEVLEQNSIDDTEQVAGVMRSCVDLGVQFALDDFGTGFSSLTHFHSLPINTLKVDRCFVQRMLEEPRDYGIVEGVLRLADAIDRPVVAEGVETIELGLLLAMNGCRYAQGYGIARPMPEEEALRWLGRWRSRPNEWLDLGDHLAGPTSHSDLNVALFSHRRWLRAMQAAIARQEMQRVEACDERTCVFASWMNGLGEARYGHRAQWDEVRALHAAVHSCVDQLARNADQGGVASLYSELLQRSQALETTLITLERHRH